MKRNETQSDAKVSAIREEIAQNEEAWRNKTAGAREALISNAEKLCSILRTPTESMISTQWAQPTHSLTLRIASETGPFEALAAHSGSPKTSKIIADRWENAHGDSLSFSLFTCRALCSNRNDRHKNARANYGPISTDPPTDHRLLVRVLRPLAAKV